MGVGFSMRYKEAATHLLYPVDDIIQRRSQVADVLAVDGSDEGAVQRAEDLVFSSPVFRVPDIAPCDRYRRSY
jgi:hypothetical protein